MHIALLVKSFADFFSNYFLGHKKAAPKERERQESPKRTTWGTTHGVNLKGSGWAAHTPPGALRAASVRDVCG